MKGSILPGRGISDWIIRKRPRRNELDPFRPHNYFIEHERMSSGGIVESAVILLTGKECPWRCLMCDLWKNTLPHRTPSGAIPAQIDYALHRLGRRARQIKLYNSGSFFDKEAVPLNDYTAIARQVASAENVIVESHPRLVGDKTLRFRDLLKPASLEVAMGLETIHPKVLPRLNKNITPEHFSAASEFLQSEKVAVRAFILIKPPFLDAEEAVEWAVITARFAYDCGVSAVSLIPTRPGNGTMDRLIESGEFLPPSLNVIERVMDAVLLLDMGRAFTDNWDLAAFSPCPSCFEARRERLSRMNLTQQLLPRFNCLVCGG